MGPAVTIYFPGSGQQTFPNVAGFRHHQDVVTFTTESGIKMTVFVGGGLVILEE